MRRALTILLSVTCTITLQALNINVVAAQSLTYQEGGPPGDATDPALDVSASSRRYVCSNGGSDSNNGLTQATAWANISKVSSSWNSIPSNAIITLCRGGSWSASSISNKSGTADSPTAIGAYGTCIPYSAFPNICSNAPRISGKFTLNGSSWITVRDISAGQFDTSFGSNNMLLYRNDGKGRSNPQSNVFRGFGGSYHMVFVENVATDASANDYFVNHSGGGENIRDGWWYIDNICAASSAEDCFDFDMAEIETESYISKDVKAVANRAVGQPIPGYSEQSGSGSLCFQGGHEGKYIWIVGNTCMGWGGRAFNIGRLSDVNPATEGKDFMQVSGNIVVRDSSASSAYSRLFVIDQYIYHNTFIQGSSGSPVQIRDTGSVIPYANQSFDYNLVYTTVTGNTSELVDVRSPDSEIISWNNNWYGNGTGRNITNGDTLAQRQASSLDVNSGEGDVAGISLPTTSTYPNPEDWRDAAFLNAITPDAGWAGCNGSNTPGARDCTGNYLGWTLDVMSGAPNSGCGWAGLPIVAVKMTELGITGQCAPRSNGTESPRPEPPVLIQ